MTKDHCGIILSQSKENYKNLNNPPIVIYNTRKKTVSVKYDFALGLIKRIKIIAPCREWMNLAHQAEADTLSFEMIEPYLYRPARDKKKGLIQYSRGYPGSFLADLRDCIRWSHTKNPLINP